MFVLLKSKNMEVDMYSKDMRLVRIFCDVVKHAENEVMSRNNEHTYYVLQGIDKIRKNLVSSLAAEYPDVGRKEIERLTRANKAL